MIRGRLVRGTLLCTLMALLTAPATAGAVNQVSFSQVGNMTTPRDAPGAGLLPDGRVLVAGGYNGTAIDSAEIFDPKTGSFSPLSATLGTPRYAPASATLPDGRILFAGGWDSSDDVTSAEVFNPSTGTFSPVGSLAVRRELASAALLPDGRVLVAGGVNTDGSLNSTEIFDPKTNTFSAGPTLPVRTWGPAVAAISGGRTLIAGGYDSGPATYLDLAFVFDLANGTMNPVSPLPSRIRSAAGASLPQGRALIAGGRSLPEGYLATALIFDPATNSFSSTGISDLIHEREEARAVELKDGRVLVVGGWDGNEVDTAEILSVPSNAFTAKVKGRRVRFAVTNEGVAQTTDASTKVATTAKKKRPKLVKSTSKHGGPGTIVVKIKLTKRGAAKLAQKGKLRVRVVYTPDQGISGTKKLKLRAGK